ncbi:10281_t:CDS:2, partial [Scutellospora calospora]
EVLRFRFFLNMRNYFRQNYYALQKHTRKPKRQINSDHYQRKKKKTEELEKKTEDLEKKVIFLSEYIARISGQLDILKEDKLQLSEENKQLTMKTIHLQQQLQQYD